MVRPPLAPRIVALVSLGMLLACGKPADAPLAPPAPSAPTVTPRFDGVYAAPVGKAGGPDLGVDLLRFLPDGKVLSLSTSSSSALESATRLVLAGSDRCAVGTYRVQDGALRFVLTSKLGSVEYAGSVHDDKLGTTWRSSINGATTEEVFSFVSVVDDRPDDPAKPGEPADESVVAAVPGTPEPTFIPDGSAWFCFRAGNASRCERKSATCESARKTAVAVRKDVKVGRCTKQAAAFCFTATQKSAARGAAYCAVTEADCKAEMATIAVDGDATELSISTCARQ